MTDRAHAASNDGSAGSAGTDGAADPVPSITEALVRDELPPVEPTGEPVLRLRDFRVTFPTHFGDVKAVRGVDLDVGAGELVGIVGESGSGKSVTFLGLMGLLPQSARIEGSAMVGDTELVGAKVKTINRVRGKRVAMIFQDPLSALNPVHRIGDQIVEMIQSHQKVNKKQAWERSVELLDIVGIPQPRD